MSGKTNEFLPSMQTSAHIHKQSYTCVYITQARQHTHSENHAHMIHDEKPTQPVQMCFRCALCLLSSTAPSLSLPVCLNNSILLLPLSQGQSSAQPQRLAPPVSSLFHVVPTWAKFDTSQADCFLCAVDLQTVGANKKVSFGVQPAQQVWWASLVLSSGSPAQFISCVTVCL